MNPSNLFDELTLNEVQLEMEGDDFVTVKKAILLSHDRSSAIKERFDDLNIINGGEGWIKKL